MRPYTFGDYALYQRDVVLKNGNGTHKIYFFSKHTPKSGEPTRLPAGYRIEVSPKTGLPLLKKDAEANVGPFSWVKRYFN